MICKYNGTCSICGKPTKAGKDIYDLETKESYHEDCRSRRDLFSASEAEELADQLGFIRRDEPIRTDWFLWKVPHAD